LAGFNATEYDFFYHLVWRTFLCHPVDKSCTSEYNRPFIFLQTTLQ